MVDTAALIWDDYNITGVPASGAKKPLKSKIREWGTSIESRVTGVEDDFAALDDNRTFATRSTAAAAAVAVGVTVIYLRGHTTDGVGGAWYKEVPDTGALEAWQFKTNSNTRRWQISERAVSPLMLGAVGDGSTDDTVAVQNTIDFIARTRSVSYVDAVDVFEGAGKTYAISATITITEHPFTRFDNGKLKAIGGAWGSTDYMVSISGAIGHSNVGIEFFLGLECEKKANGLKVSSAPRSIIEPFINKFKDTGMQINEYNWLAHFGGTLHEYEDTDADFTDPVKRVATGVHITSVAGDIVVNVKVGWTYRCVLNESGGPVSIGGHWYTSSTTVAIDGIVYEHNTNAITSLGCDSACYLDTGRIVYRKGFLHIGPAAFFFNNTPVMHVSKTAYIDMVANSAGQYHSIKFDGIQRSDRAMPLMKKVESGGNTWANIHPDLLLANRDHIIRLDPYTFAVGAFTNSVAFWVTNFTGGCYHEMADLDTTYKPKFGVKADALEFYTSGTLRITVKSGGDVDFSGNIQRGGVQVVGARQTGWGTPTGTLTRTTFATGSVTLPQLAERVAALITDLRTHGLINN